MKSVSQKVVLFVDDEPLAQKYFKASISPFAEVLTASNPIEAKEILSERRHGISVVVSDERMPLESGVPFLTDVRRSWPFARRVLTSAYADVDNLQDAINEAAIYRFVPKPWNLDQLCDVVRDALKDDESDTHTAANRALDPRNLVIADAALLLAKPLQDLELEAAQLMALTGSGRIPAPSSSQPHFGMWPSHMSQSQITACASRLQRAAATCLSLAAAIIEVTKPRTLQ